ncbi:MAG: MFS transporter [Clostridiales bacterium]|nr:MFS transporter [Clostridiales bacterium]
MKGFRNRMLFPLCQGEHRKSQILFIFDGILINAAVTLTTGFFMSGYLVTLKANDFLVGILNSAPTWSLIISLFSFMIFEKMETRKTLLITMNMVSRFLKCSIVYLPFLIKDNTALIYLTTIMVILSNLIWSIYSVGIMVWMISLLPNDHTKSRYIYLRMFWLRISFTVFSLAMGLLLDLFNKSLTGFVIVFTISLILSLADAIVLMNVHEPKNKVRKATKKIEVGSFLEPLKTKEYRQFLLFIFAYYFSLSLSSSFTSLYQIRYLKLNYSLISVIYTVSYINMIIGTRLWDRIETKKGQYFVLSAGAILMASEFFLYGFMTQKTLLLFIITPFLAGIGASGFNVATVNYRYSLMPEDGQRTIYEGWFGAAMGLGSLLGPTVGSMIRDLIPSFTNSVFQYSGYQIMYLISFVLASLAVYLKFFRSRGLTEDESKLVQ